MKYFLETQSFCPFFNLAFEEYFLTQKNDSYFILWQNDKTVVIGQNQNAVAEIDSDYTRLKGINLIRRTTGGGAVYHDLGNINYSIIDRTDDLENLTYKEYSQPILKALSSLKLSPECSGRNDILLDGQKISGTAQRVYKNRILFHGTLLFDSDMGAVAGALRADDKKYTSKASKSVRSRVTNIREHLRKDMDVPTFFNCIKKSIIDGGYAPLSVSPEELSAINKLKEEKYDTWEWNYGRSPKYETKNKKTFQGGTIEAVYTVTKGILTGICFYGDFLSRKPIDEVTSLITDKPFKRDVIRDILSNISAFNNYFGDIRIEEVLDTLFFE